MQTTKHSSYLYNLFSKPNALLGTVIDSIEVLKQRNELSGCTHLACMGISGLAVAAPLSVALSIPLIVARKKSEKSHREVMIEGVPKTDDYSYIIIDDFICSGATLAGMIKDLGGQLLGAYLWSIQDFRDADDLCEGNGRIASALIGDYDPETYPGF